VRLRPAIRLGKCLASSTHPVSALAWSKHSSTDWLKSLAFVRSGGARNSLVLVAKVRPTFTGGADLIGARHPTGQLPPDIRNPSSVTTSLASSFRPFHSRSHGWQVVMSPFSGKIISVPFRQAGTRSTCFPRAQREALDGSSQSHRTRRHPRRQNARRTGVEQGIG
jgi:hypothetical protein